MPLITSQELEKFDLVLTGCYAFVAFCFVASAVYVLNDLADLSNDRQHHEKRSRPFASGELSLLAGLVLIPSLLIVGVLIAVLLLPIEFSIFSGAILFLTSPTPSLVRFCHCLRESRTMSCLTLIE